MFPDGCGYHHNLHRGLHHYSHCDGGQKAEVPIYPLSQMEVVEQHMTDFPHNHNVAERAEDDNNIVWTFDCKKATTSTLDTGYKGSSRAVEDFSQQKLGPEELCALTTFIFHCVKQRDSLKYTIHSHQEIVKEKAI